MGEVGEIRPGELHGWNFAGATVEVCIADGEGTRQMTGTSCFFVRSTRKTGGVGEVELMSLENCSMVQPGTETGLSHVLSNLTVAGGCPMMASFLNAKNLSSHVVGAKMEAGWKCSP
eukprot:2401962-Ditylum_brightwellii.AAC.1